MVKNKILVLTSTFPRWKNDHEPSFIFDLCLRLKNRFDIHVVAPHAKDSESYEEINGLSISRFHYAPENLESLAYNGGISSNLRRQPFKYLLVVPFLVSEFYIALRLIKKHHIDLVHAHWLIPHGLLAILLQKVSGNKINILISAHGSDVYSFNGLITGKIKKFVLNNCSNITVVSNAMKTAIIEMGCRCRVDVLPMGTDLARKFVPDANIRKPQQIIYVGRLIAQKGVNFLLDAFANIVKDHPQATLQILGHGPELEALKRQSYNLGVDNNVLFLGGMQHDKVNKYLQASSIAVFPYCRTKYSGEEGFGLVLVEALGCGCAVIASRQPAIMEIINDRQTGLLVEEKSPKAITSAILSLLENPEMASMLAKNGRSEVLNKFDWEKVSRSYTNLINNCIHQ